MSLNYAISFNSTDTKYTHTHIFCCWTGILHLFTRFSCGCVISPMNFPVTEVQIYIKRKNGTLFVQRSQWLIIISGNGNRIEMKIQYNICNCFCNVSTTMTTAVASATTVKIKTIEPHFYSWTSMDRNNFFFSFYSVELEIFSETF